MVLTKQTYNNQDKHKKPKDIHTRPQKLNLCVFCPFVYTVRLWTCGMHHAWFRVPTLLPKNFP